MWKIKSAGRFVFVALESAASRLNPSANAPSRVQGRSHTVGCFGKSYSPLWLEHSATGYLPGIRDGAQGLRTKNGNVAPTREGAREEMLLHAQTKTGYAEFTHPCRRGNP